MTRMDEAPIHLPLQCDTVVVTGATPHLLATLPHFQFDKRTSTYRAEGRYYRPLVEHLRQHQLAYKDEARAYQATPWTLRTTRSPFPHQSEAVQAWWGFGGRGVVVLPTGTGKTFVAMLAIH